MNARPVFTLGQLVATPGAIDALDTNHVSIASLLDRHLGGDWGDLVPEDITANDHAVAANLRILSAYKVGTGKVWVITEADRSSTTILLPEEY